MIKKLSDWYGEVSPRIRRTAYHLSDAVDLNNYINLPFAKKLADLDRYIRVECIEFPLAQFHLDHINKMAEEIEKDLVYETLRMGLG
jgi:hypothetical protein